MNKLQNTFNSMFAIALLFSAFTVIAQESKDSVEEIGRASCRERV